MPNLSEAGLSLEVEGNSTQVESPQIMRPIKGITESSTETVDVEAIYEIELQPCFLSNILVMPNHPTGSILILESGVYWLNEYLEVPSFRMMNYST